MIPKALMPSKGNSLPPNAAMHKDVKAPKEWPTSTIPWLPFEYSSYAFLIREMYRGVETLIGVGVEGIGLPPYPGRLMFKTSKPRALKFWGILASY
jgi:hypothetical protein